MERIRLRISRTTVFVNRVMNIRVIYLRQEISCKNTWLTMSQNELHIHGMFKYAVTDMRAIKYGIANKNIFVKYYF
jgi:hypothetical protein